MSYPRRAAPDFGGFGGMFTRPPKATLAIMVVTGVLSIFSIGSLGWSSGGIYSLLAYSPASVLDRLWVWTPLTYLFVSIDGLGLVLHIAISLWIFGSHLERQWGTERYLLYFFSTGVGAALLTTALGAFLPGLRMASPVLFQGTWIVGLSLLLGWVLMNWHQTILFFFVPLPAPVVLGIALLFVFLRLLAGQWQSVVPVGFSLGIGYLMLQRRGISLRRAYLQFRAWWIERQLRRKARHLRVVPPPDRDRDDKPTRYLH